MTWKHYTYTQIHVKIETMTTMILDNQNVGFSMSKKFFFPALCSHFVGFSSVCVSECPLCWCPLHFNHANHHHHLTPPPPLPPPPTTITTNHHHHHQPTTHHHHHHPIHFTGFTYLLVFFIEINRCTVRLDNQKNMYTRFI